MANAKDIARMIVMSVTVALLVNMGSEMNNINIEVDKRAALYIRKMGFK